jgi:hypothetical protein
LAVNKINKKISNLYILLGKIENEQNKWLKAIDKKKAGGLGGVV